MNSDITSVESYISQEQLKKRIAELGQEISQEFAGEHLIVVGVLNGAFMFCADLVREIKGCQVDVQFLGAASYHGGTESSGNVKITYDLKSDIKDKHILIVEDIVDTGLTIKSLKDLLASRKPKSIKLASLLYKPARNIHRVEIDYLAFEIQDKFVIGFGLDHDGKYRELPYIGVWTGA